MAENAFRAKSSPQDMQLNTIMAKKIKQVFLRPLF